MAGRSHSGARGGFRAILAPMLSPTALALSGFTAAAVLLGGASAAGVIPNLILQLLALCLVVSAAVWPARRPLTGAERALLWMGALFVAVVLLQLIPLPPSIWGALPGRAPVVAEFHLLGAPLPWLPLALNPAGAVSDLVKVAIVAGAFAAAYRASDAGLSGFAWVLVGLAAVSVLIGLAQLTSDGNSPLYFYAITNRDQPVGFFANSNHLATLELMAIPFVAALAARRGSQSGRGRLSHYIVLAALGVLLLGGLVINGSVAGLGLLLPTLIGSFFVIRTSGRARRTALIGLGVMIVLGIGIFVLALNSPLLHGFAKTSLDTGPTSRVGFIRHTAAGIAAYFPTGSGLGSFVSVFPRFEDPNVVDSIFVNHAHNDYLELMLELGLPGMLLLIAFLAWWAWRVLAVWRDRDSGAFQRAATVASAAVLAHSLVDYPLRMAAISTVFAVCCTILARPRRLPPAPPPAKDQPAARHLSG